MTTELTQLNINYPPNFEVRYGHGKPLAKHIERIFQHRLEFQLKFIETIASYTKNYLKIPLKSTDVLLPEWVNGFFPPLDAMSLYSMIASRKTNRYVEIGSGNSTKFARLAIQDHNLSTQITSIDPHPRAEIDEISDIIIRSPLESIDLSVFSELTKNDIVFFDGSHRCFQNSDVTVFFTDVIPELPTEITIGIHDIFWPFDYPGHWINRYYNEQYVLGAYMLGVGLDFPLIFGCNFIGKNYSDVLPNSLSSEFVEYLFNAKLWLGGGCLWFNKP